MESRHGDIEGFDGARVLVSGGAGAIGSNLTAALMALGADVVVLDDLSSGYSWNLPSASNLLFVEGSVLDEGPLRRVFRERPQIVFHLAAFFANQNSVDYPERDLAVNGVGTLRLLEYATLIGVERFVFASSSSIYGGSPSLPVTEDDVSVELTTPYQMTKLLGEMYCGFYARNWALPIVRARLFNSYGPGEVPGQYRNVVPNFIYWALRGELLPITGGAEASRDFTFVTDIVDGLLRCGSIPEAVGQAFNLAAGREVRIRDLAHEIVRLTESRSSIVETDRRPWDTKPRFVASNDKARKLLGFAPTMNIEDGLAVTIEWFRDRWDTIEAAADFPPGASAALRGAGSNTLP